ncbi:hypothetical protein BT63DRAFT_426754 [Microthyrium microscopicum]|uniref:Uncharacterized protein n=1 Tax=Microthyrium microscopicum TaxID=703497 RepID=A0A6A6U6M2_9PEZI|nr:hypothetical protein BT63DRAFT_426754 [Microthyrium microscopicum]
MPLSAIRRRAPRVSEATQADTNNVESETTNMGSDNEAKSHANITSSSQHVPISTMATQLPSEALSNPPETVSLCFYDAAMKRKEKAITEEQYLQAIAAHCSGVRHGKNRLCNSDSSDFLISEDKYNNFLNRRHHFAKNVRGEDPFASSVAQFIMDYIEEKDNPVHDIQPILEVLRAFRADDYVAFTAGLCRMDETYYKDDERPAGAPRLSFGLCFSLATVAIVQRKVGVLKAILQCTRNVCDGDFDQEYRLLMEKPDTNREILRVINEAGYKGLWPPGYKPTIVDLIW